MERLAQITRYCFVGTRIAKQTADGRPLARYPIAYLLGPQECNNDNTNFWIFSEEGLKRLINRTGWSLLSYLAIGDTTNSTPDDPDPDERAFCFLQKTLPTLSASPNSVPAGEGNGKTTISRNTAGKSGGKLFVSANEGEESLFAASRQGSAAADWIRSGLDYEFRLYNSDHTELLAKVVVNRAAR